MIFWPVALVGAAMFAGGMFVTLFPEKVRSVLKNTGSALMGERGAGAFFGSKGPVRFAGILFLLIGVLALVMSFVIPATSPRG